MRKTSRKHFSIKQLSLKEFLLKEFLPKEFLPKEFLPKEFLLKGFLPKEFLLKEFLLKQLSLKGFLLKEFLLKDFSRKFSLLKLLSTKRFCGSEALPSIRRSGRFRRLVAIPAAAAVILTSAGSFALEKPRAASAAPTAFKSAAAAYAFSFPRDHAAHPDYRTEWWYYTGHVTTAAGRRFGYELTFFRIGMRPGDPQPLTDQSRWRGHELYPAHFALTDEQGQTFFHTERFVREALGDGAASASALDVRAGDWTLRGAPAGNPALERMVLSASAETPAGRNAINFVQMPEKPPAVHGHGGVSRKAACASCASHYYSYTRLRTSGTLVYHGQRFAISGLSWMDHEFGSGELEASQAGWDWFSIQLADRRELMLYVLREKDGRITPQSSGSLIEPDGSVRNLPLGSFAIAATGTWRSPHTGGTYPSGWRVRVAAAGIDVVLAPTVRDQELASTSTGVSYWEGAVDVRDAAGGRLAGVGYVELTGYAGAVSM